MTSSAPFSIHRFPPLQTHLRIYIHTTNMFNGHIILTLFLFFSPTAPLRLLLTLEQLQFSISPIDLAALHQIKLTLTPIHSSSSSFFSTWDFTSQDPCSTFSGITCSVFPDGIQHVTTLTLADGLAGSLTPSISSLTHLTQLILFPGIVTGPIPSQIGNLKNLRVISLTNNRLTNRIPNSIFALPNLHTLDLSRNLLTGTIPLPLPGGGGSLDLKVLILASNDLYGDIPNLPDGLLHIDLKQNRLSGTLPEKMPLTLRYLSVSENKMWGPLNSIEQMSELVYLDLSMNQFSGPLERSLFKPSISSMFLQRNNFSGPVPTDLSSSNGPGSIVDLSHNFLTGDLPSGLSGVESLFLNNNKLSGSVPEEYVESVCSGTMKTLYLQHNYIQNFPVRQDRELPDSVALCLTYNCMVPPAAGLTECPDSAGERVSRPVKQCSTFNNGSSSSSSIG